MTTKPKRKRYGVREFEAMREHRDRLIEQCRAFEIERNYIAGKAQELRNENQRLWNGSRILAHAIIKLRKRGIYLIQRHD